MVHSSVLTVSTDGERLTCNGFSLGETICFRSLEFIADYFGADYFHGFILQQASNLTRAMTEDSTEEFFTASSREWSSGLPSS
jgi:hypothetical protein